MRKVRACESPVSFGALRRTINVHKMHCHVVRDPFSNLYLQCVYEFRISSASLPIVRWPIRDSTTNKKITLIVKHSTANKNENAANKRKHYTETVRTLRTNSNPHFKLNGAARCKQNRTRTANEAENGCKPNKTRTANKKKMYARAESNTWSHCDQTER